jgi:hypothetical protein
MENKINIAELLKDCPKGMELDCAMYEDCKFLDVDVDPGNSYLIQITTPCGIRCLDKYGRYTNDNKAKCVIFPKGKTTWEGFKRPFKDGDIVVNASNEYSNAFIYAGENNYYYECYVGLMTDYNPKLSTNKSLAWVDKKSGIRLATEEEKQRLFDAIKANGYKWNETTKTLEKLVKPKFKVGDRIKHRLTGEVYKVLFVLSNGDGGGVYDVAITNEIEKSIDIKEQDNYELVFDITTLKPFDKVLCRMDNDDIWGISLFERYVQISTYPFFCIQDCFSQCIPYEGNEHLLGTTDDCDEFYKTWE